MDTFGSSASLPPSERRNHAAFCGFNRADWTDKVLASTSSEKVSVDVSLRVLDPDVQQAVEESTSEIQNLYRQIPPKESALIQTGRELATAICEIIPEKFRDDPAKELRSTVPETAQVISTIKGLIAVLEDQLAYEASFAYELTNKTTTWTRWGLSVLPVVSSLSYLIEDACSVTEAGSGEVIGKIENMLLSLGILIADLLAIQFGVAGRAATFVMGRARKYLLGFIARTLGLKAYVTLLRELFTLTRSGVTEALQLIKQTTREIGEKYRFISQEEVSRVNSMTQEDLESPDFDIDFLTLSPECETE